MLARNRAEVDSPNVTYVQADLFDWQPSRTYDVVFFGFWLSHVPPVDSTSSGPWSGGASALTAGSRSSTRTSAARASTKFAWSTACRLARRALADGRELESIKLFWNADELAARLRAIGWTFDIRLVGDVFMYGVGTPL